MATQELLKPWIEGAFISQKEKLTTHNTRKTCGRRAVLKNEISSSATLLPESNEVGGSYHMEQEGLRRSLEKMEDFMEVGTLVTLLSSTSLTSGMLAKKLHTLSPTRDCQDLIKPWVGSIFNHLYWAIISTPAGNGQLIADKWKSVLKHIHNRHNGFAGLFPQCTHGPL
ncbi:ATP-dependent DNA helicase chl1 [Branchiostoma belcheri]|nr:ATP-dependent DNA helicase chl1 [Branchiostoma belcheri]